MSKNSKDHKTLFFEIEKAAHHTCNLVLSNGETKNSSCQYFKCFKCSYCYRNKWRSRAKEPHDETPLRSTALINEKENIHDKIGKSDAESI